MSRTPFGGPSALTVVIMTLNEADRLDRCLARIPERYPVLVLDSGSTDRTVALAEAAGCAVRTNPWPGFAAQRNVALTECGIASPWVLFVDADELYRPDFFDWFEREGQRRTDFDVGQVTSTLVFRGQPLRRAPGYPIHHPRLIRRGTARFVRSYSGHGETVEAGTRQAEIDIPYDHHFFDGDFAAWMVKHVRLAQAEAFPQPGPGHRTARARLQALVPGLLRMPVRFLYHYLLRGGFLDGRNGFLYALMYAWFELTKSVFRAAGPHPPQRRP